jgi:aromatic ring-opening dioxygenase LigB subunit
MAELGRRFEAAAPEVTILFTPHNVHVSDHFAVVAAGRVEGSLASWDDDLRHVRLEVSTHGELAAALLAEARRSLPVVAVSYGGNDAAAAAMPMDWATLIPLWFMRGTPVVVAIPCREQDAVAHVAFGAACAAAADRLGLRTAVIASADHGHGHRADGPYGYTPVSREFDDRIVDVVRRGALAELTGFDRQFVEDAKADSWWQLLMLGGALDAAGGAWRADLLSYEAPTYFGMLCASFLPI